MATSPVEYTIGGVNISFPCKAYPSQLAMMNSVSNHSKLISQMLAHGPVMNCGELFLCHGSSTVIILHL